MSITVPGLGSGVPPLMAFDYDRTIVGFHGTRVKTARSLVDGKPFDQSTNDDDWLGHGIYFWEFAPRQAWWWAERRYGTDAAVVGSLIRLGRCFDLLDPGNVNVLATAHDELNKALTAGGQPMPGNANNHKYLDCAVFNYMYQSIRLQGYTLESARAVFVPGGSRLWTRSGVFREAHIQICVREPDNILAVWPVKKDGRYGRD